MKTIITLLASIVIAVSVTACVDSRYNSRRYYDHSSKKHKAHSHHRNHHEHKHNNGNHHRGHRK